MLIQKLFILIIAVLFSVYGCAGVKTEQKSEQPAPSLMEEKVDQSKKEESPPPQPIQEPPPQPAVTTAPPPALESPKTTRPPEPLLPSPTPLRTTKIAWDSVNLREGPGTNYKVVGNVKKGTSLSVLEDKGSWLRIRLQNGSEAWVSKAATSEALKPSPAITSKPKPM